MSEQQVVIECILEKFSRKHGSENAPLAKENDAMKNVAKASQIMANTGP